MITFYIQTLGCKVNQSDTAKLKSNLEKVGFKYSRNGSDIVIINTCAVTKTAVRKCRYAIRRVHRENPEAKIVITGCWPKIYKGEIKMSPVDLIWRRGNNDGLIRKLVKWQRTISKFRNTKNVIKDSLPTREIEGVPRDKTRYFLKIQDGCEQYCSYCIIPFARGKLRSRPVREIYAEAMLAVKAGYQEIVLCGIHLGLYGKETKNGENSSRREKFDLLKLVRCLLKINGLGRIRISSIEVSEVSDRLVALMQADKKICPQLHIPLQSGCDKILKLMNRPYDRKFYRDKIMKIRKALPRVAITTDVIVGFPGESRNDFDATHKFIKKIKFSRLHVFPFSANDITAAAKMPGQVDKKEIALRAVCLRKLGKELEKEYQKKLSGITLEVLIEKSDHGKYAGKTEYYFDVEFDRAKIHPSDKAKLARNHVWRGQIVKVRL